MNASIKSGQKRILAGSTSDSGPIFGVALMLWYVLLNIMNHQNKVKTNVSKRFRFRTRQWSWRNGFRRL
jgi:hypothetical protein